MTIARGLNRSWHYGLLGAQTALRLAFVPFTSFGNDEWAIYDKSARFFLTGHPSVTGARVVYSGTELPGMLQDLATGLPLFWSGGWPWASVVCIALLTALAADVLARLYIRWFPEWDARAVYAAVVFAPWTFAYCGFLNPAFLFPLSVLALWGLVPLLAGKGERRHAIALGAAVPLALQVNLAAVFLGAWVALIVALSWIRGKGAWWARVRAAAEQWRWESLLGGAGIGSLTLLPYFWSRSATVQGGRSGFLLANIHFDWVHLQDLYKVYFRFLTFPTGELTRFLGGPRGFGGALARMAEHPVLLASGVLAIPLAVWAIVWGVRFTARISVLRDAGKVVSGAAADAERRALVPWVWAAPFVMMALFVFSLKEPSAHTLLPLLPLSFFPFFWEYRHRPFAFPAVAVAVVASTVFGLGCYVRGVRPTLWTISTAARCVVLDPTGRACSRTQREALLEADPHPVRLIVETVRGVSGK